MVIFLALNEKFKADVKPQSLSDFTENVESLIGDVPANQTVIRKQFEVKEIKVKIRPFFLQKLMMLYSMNFYLTVS